MIYSGQTIQSTGGNRFNDSRYFMHQPESIPPVGDPPAPPPYQPEPVELPPAEPPVIPTRARSNCTLAALSE